MKTSSSMFESNWPFFVFQCLSCLCIVLSKNFDNVLPPACSEMDLIIILDSSSSVGRKIWPTEVEFASRLINRLPLGPDETRVGIVDFSGAARTRVNLNRPEAISQKGIQRVLEKLKRDYRPGITFLDLALRKAAYMYRKVRIPRLAGKLLIIITDGQASPRRRRTAKQLMDGHLKSLKKMGVEIISIGVGKYVKPSELRYIASGRKQVLQVSDFNALLSEIDTTLRKLCKNKCQRDMNLVIALDCSGSIGFWSWNKELEFVRILVRKLDLPYSDTRIGLIVFHDNATIFVDISREGASMKQITSKLTTMKYLWQPLTRTYTNLALKLAIQMLKTAKITRDLPSTLLLVTDGKSSYGWNSLKESVETLKRNNVDTYSVGVGPYVDYSELRGIARNKDHVYIIKSFADLATVTPRVVSHLCNGVFGNLTYT